MSKKQSAFGKPKTLYELCEQTVEAILASPQNYYQDDWACPVESVTDDFGEKPKAMKEACGTAYCRAGWMGAILGQKRITDGSLATRLFESAGIDYLDTSDLFDVACDSSEFNLGFGDGELNPGTKAYAKAGANGLRVFMRRHAKKLRAAELVKDGSGRWQVRMSANSGD